MNGEWLDWCVMGKDALQVIGRQDTRIVGLMILGPKVGRRLRERKWLMGIEQMCV